MGGDHWTNANGVSATTPSQRPESTPASHRYGLSADGLQRLFLLCQQNAPTPSNRIDDLWACSDRCSNTPYPRCPHTKGIFPTYCRGESPTRDRGGLSSQS